jgi:hypothetical protein
VKVTERKVSRTGYLSLRQGAQWLGMGSDRAAARRLQRLLERLERATRQTLIRRGVGGRGAVLLVTKAVLRDYLPEHFSRREKLAGVVREQLNEIRTDVQRLRVENRVIGRIVARILREFELEDLAVGSPREPTGARRAGHPNSATTRAIPTKNTRHRRKWSAGGAGRDVFTKEDGHEK